MENRPFINQLSSQQIKKILHPVEVSIWLAVIVIIGVILLTPVLPGQQIPLFSLLVLSILYVYLYFHIVIPQSVNNPRLFHISTLASVFLVAGFHYLLGDFLFHIDNFYLLIIIFLGFFGSWEWLVPTFILVGGLNYIINSIFWNQASTQYILSQIYDLTSFGITAVVGYFISRTIGDYDQASTEQKEALTLLLESNRSISPNTNLLESLPTYARHISEGLPTTTCRITLLNSKKDKLLDYGIYPLRYLSGLKKELGGEYPLDQLPKHKQVVKNKESLILDQNLEQDTLTDFERRTLFWRDVQTVGIFPILLDDEILGLISIGEARSMDREPFDPTQLSLLSTLTNQIAATINTYYLHQDLQNQAQRMTVLYEVGQAISKTIEIDDLLELIYQQLKKVLPSDAYFVALYQPDEHQLDLRMLIDKGKRYPPQQTDADQGLSSWIVDHHQPLLIKDLSQELDSLPVQPLNVGEEEMTRSWLGVPLLYEDRFIGLIAVASYLPHQFDELDLALLEQIGRQAALSIQNARHHAEVERQASLDSLTGVLNHGSFVERATRQAEQALQSGQPCSLIMLDIDHFKAYNDTYGHVVGDQVLRLTAQAIQSHIKKEDAVGRWGGEEFAITLPEASAPQALKVAQRIRKTLASLPLNNHLQETLPKPTVSQGIAALPTHSEDIEDLIIIADRALYQAKEHGRDQIQIAQTGSSAEGP